MNISSNIQKVLYDKDFNVTATKESDAVRLTFKYGINNVFGIKIKSRSIIKEAMQSLFKQLYLRGKQIPDEVMNRMYPLAIDAFDAMTA